MEKLDGRDPGYIDDVVGFAVQVLTAGLVDHLGVEQLTFPGVVEEFVQILAKRVVRSIPVSSSRSSHCILDPTFEDEPSAVQDVGVRRG
ncbi:MAG: hypothetical protein ACOC8O_01680 [Natronomonas sp.]